VTDEDSSVPIACSLTAGAARDREREWRELLSRALISRTPAVGGVRVELRALPGARGELERLIAAEMECCPFMTMSVETTAAGLALTVTAAALAAPLVEQLFAGVAV
jgi:MerR family transcriptional regulator, copper efflux regulator